MPRSRWSLSDQRVRRLLFQAALLAAVLGVVWFLSANAASNIARRGLELGFAFLGRTARASSAIAPPAATAGRSWSARPRP
jgi:ABC-type amino acid transport system permease subunit